MCFIHLSREHEDRLTFDQTCFLMQLHCSLLVIVCHYNNKSKKKKKKAASAGPVSHL